jgi:hypothetical protein
LRASCPADSGLVVDKDLIAAIALLLPASAKFFATLIGCPNGFLV